MNYDISLSLYQRHLPGDIIHINNLMSLSVEPTQRARIRGFNPHRHKNIWAAASA